MKNLLFHFSLLMALVLGSLTGNTQNPVFSATQNWLNNVNYNTCMQRARETMINNGFSATQQSDNVSFIGSKAGYNAYLICQTCQDKVITTIVLSTSNNLNEANALRDRMLLYIATGRYDNIIAGPVNIFTNKKIFSAGEKITVEYSGMAGNTQDWITLVQTGKPDNQYGPWKYTEGRRSGSMIFDGLPAGEYEARAYFNNGYVVEKRYSFTVQGTDGSTNAIQATWTTQADTYRGKNGQRFTYYFPPGGTASGRLWGTDVYTDDSSIGTAAVHAGLITFQNGGTVTIEIRAGQPAYQASTRNGITSSSYGSWSGSFVFVR